jgi:hypothetical protein
LSEQRHPYSAELCDRLEQIAWGDAATNILSRPLNRNSMALIQLPVFVWDHPLRTSGRKSKSRQDAARLLFPVRVKWAGVDSSILLLESGTTVTLEWSAPGCKNIASKGTMVVHALKQGVMTNAEAREINFSTHVPPAVSVSSVGRLKVRTALQRYANVGRDSRWRVLRMFEENLRWNFTRALASVDADVLSGTQPRNGGTHVRDSLSEFTRVIDVADAESIQTNILYGSDGDDKSLALTLIQRCLEGNAFDRVDPELYVRRWMFSTAESAIRRHIGDPHIGRTIRQVAREIDSDDPVVVREEFAKRFPKKSLGVSRTEAALSAASRATQATPLHVDPSLIENLRSRSNS